jgi:hypothetical protein
MTRFHYWIFTIGCTLMLGVAHEAQAGDWGWHPHAGFTKAMGYSALAVGLLAFVIICSFLPRRRKEEKETGRGRYH